MSAKLLMLNGVVGVTSTLAAASTMWMVVTNPAALADAAAHREYAALAVAVGEQLAVWLHALLRFI